MNRLEELMKKLEEIEANGDDDFIGQADEYRRQVIVDMAVKAADEIIKEGSDGSVEETEYLTSAIAEKLVGKAHIANIRRLLSKDIMKHK